MPRFALGKGEKKFFKNVSTFVGGRAVASAITILSTPIVSRLFLPEDFGGAALFLAISTSVGPLAAASYDRAVQVARSEEDVHRLLVLCLWLVAIVSIASAPVLMILGKFGVWTETLNQWGLLLWLLPFGIAAEGGVAAINSWLLRLKQYKALVAGEITQTTMRSLMRIGSGLVMGSSIGALVVSYVVAYWTKFWILIRICREIAPFPALEKLRSNPREIAAIARSYSDFPRYNLPTGIVMQITKQLPVFVLANKFGLEVVGFFAMADRVTGAPIHIVTNTLRQAFLQRLADIWNSGRSIHRPLTRMVAGLAALVLIPALITWIWGEELLTLILGKKWHTAGQYVEIMAPYFVVQFLSAPYHAATAAMRRQRLWFWLQLLSAVSRFAIVPVAAMSWATPKLVVTTFVWTTVATSLLAMIVVQLTVPKVHPGLKSE